MMKTITLLTALLLGGTLAAQAQSKVQAGLKSGLTVAVLDGQINQNTDYKTGFHLGGVLRLRPGKHFAFQPELVYSQQGSNNELPVGYGITLESKTKLSYLNLPLLAKIYLGNVVNVQAGPQFGLLLTAREVGQTSYSSGSGGSGYRTEDLDVKDDYKGDVGLCLGLGADLKNGLFLAARANYGLSNSNNNEQQQQFREQFDIGGLHNRVLEFSVGYLFGAE